MVVAGLNLRSTTRGKENMKVLPRLTVPVIQPKHSSDEEMKDNEVEMISEEDEDQVLTVAASGVVGA